MVQLLGILALVVLKPSVVATDKDYHEIINGTQLHFRVRGTREKNPYLILLHGGPGFSGLMFYPWGRSLEKDLNVVYLDQRGCGESAKVKPSDFAAFTMPNLTADIEGVRKFLKVKRWFVLGHSWGGMLGLEYVHAYPRSVLGYLHVDGLISQPLTQDGIIDFSEAQIKHDEDSSDPTIKARAARLKPYVPYARGLKPGLSKLLSTNQFAFAYFNEIYYDSAKKGSDYRALILSALQEYKTPADVLGPRTEPTQALEKSYGYSTKDLTSILPEVRTRVLVINGKQDGIIQPTQAKLAAKGIPHARLVMLDHCGHFPFAEQPELFTQTILDFVHGRTIGEIEK
jgi:proline iminopeptidase